MMYREYPDENLKTAKRFVTEKLKTEPKATAEYIITNELCNYFKLDSKDIKPLKELHKAVSAKVKEGATKAEKARKEEEAIAEKARKVEEKKAKEEAKAKPKKPRVPFDIVADRVMHENFIFCMHDTREFYIYVIES